MLLIDIKPAIEDLADGLPVGCIADMLHLKRPVVWQVLEPNFDPTDYQGDYERLELMYPVLKSACCGTFTSALFRIWKARGTSGKTLAELCCAYDLDIAEIKKHLAEFAQSIDRYTKQAAIVMKPSSYRGNGFIDDSLVVDWPR